MCGGYRNLRSARGINFAEKTMNTMDYTYHHLLPALVVLAVDYCGLLVAVLADLAAGVSKARRRGTPLTSKGFRASVDKFARYVLALFGMTAVDAVIIAVAICLQAGGDCEAFTVLPVVTSAGAAAMALIEVKSIFETEGEKNPVDEAAEMLRRLIDLINRK